MSRYAKTPREIADALQTVVDDLRAMPDTELPGIGVQVYVQAHQMYGTPEERMRAVDLLGWHLTGKTGEMNEDGDHYGLPYAAGGRKHLATSVFTNPTVDGAR